MLKKNGGITLIALVITIIVLLILAGVSIAMLSGENGLLTRSTQAADKEVLAGAKDVITTDVAAYLADYYEAKYVSNTAGTSGKAAYVGSQLTHDYTTTTKVQGCSVTAVSATSITIQKTGADQGDANATGLIDPTEGTISWQWGTVAAADKGK